MLRIKKGHSIAATTFAKLEGKGAVKIEAFPRLVSGNEPEKVYEIVVIATTADGWSWEVTDCPRPCPDVEDDGQGG